MTLFGIVSAALTLLLAAAAWTDYRSRRIPNVLTITGLAAALVLRAVVGPGRSSMDWWERCWRSCSTLPLIVLGVMVAATPSC